jgi:hypothetical protein
MPDNNAAQSVYQYLLAENIHVDFEEFKFQATTHPDYPAVLAYSDALRFFGVLHVAAKLNKRQVSELPDRFVALMVDFDEQEMLAFVQRRGDTFQFIKNGKLRTLDANAFSQEWKEVVLLAEGQAQPVEKTARPLLPGWLAVALALALTLAALPLTWANGLHLLLVLLGGWLAILAVQSEWGQPSAVGQLLCGPVTAGCKSNIQSSQGLMFGTLHFTDASVVFFGGQWLALLLLAPAGWMPLYYTYHFAALLAALPLTWYSLYLQRAVTKKWCTICLLTIGVVYLQLVGYLWLPHDWSLLAQWKPLALYLLAFALTAAVWLPLKALLNKYHKQKADYQQAVRFKRNYGIFRHLLLQDQPVDFSAFNESFLLGNPQAALRLTLVTNPFCGHCASMHTIMEQLLQLYGDRLCVALRFNYRPNGDDDYLNLHLQLAKRYRQKGAAAFTTALGDWFGHKNMGQWMGRYALPTDGEDSRLLNWLQQQQICNAAAQLNFTPALFVGPYAYPTEYDRQYLLHFLPDLLEDDLFTPNNHRQ